MKQDDRSEFAAAITSNPLWALMKEELPRYYYENFRATTDEKQRERLALAHDMFDDVMQYIEAQAAMGAVIDFPEDKAAGDGSP